MATHPKYATVGAPQRLYHPATAEAIYTDEEREFMTALDDYKRHNKRVYMTWREVLLVALSLGYRKVADKIAPPVYRKVIERVS